jgi:hypothetical protein
MKIVGIIAWAVILPFAFWFSLIALTHHGIRPQSGLPEWILLGIPGIVGGLGCFRLPVAAGWRTVGFIIYVPVIALALTLAGAFFDCLVYHSCP